MEWEQEEEAELETELLINKNMKKQEFETKYKPLSQRVNDIFGILSNKYKNVIYGKDPDAREKYGEDYILFEEMMNSDKKMNEIYNEYQNAELKSQHFYSEPTVDLSIAIEVHDILLEKEFYKEHLDKNEDFDFVKVIYNCLYNDNWNDLLVAKLQLFKGNKFLREIVIFDESLYEDENVEGDEGEGLYEKKQPFEIEMYDCRVYSNNEAYQSFIVSKNKCSL